VENLRKEEFFKNNQLIKIHTASFLKQAKSKFFVLLVFGSYAKGTQDKKSDIDLLIITNEEELERKLAAALSTIRTHITAIRQNDFQEMIMKRDEVNIANETIDNHIIIYGAEQYYAMLGQRYVR
jgi:predicted nucleotidyltransferase